MSRLNYLTEEELALDGINQELTTLERLCAEGRVLNEEQVRILSGYRDRVLSMLSRPPGPVEQHPPVPCVASTPSVATRPSRPSEPPEQEADVLRTSIRQCLGRGVTG